MNPIVKDMFEKRGREYREPADFVPHIASDWRVNEVEARSSTEYTWESRFTYRQRILRGEDPSLIATRAKREISRAVYGKYVKALRDLPGLLMGLDKRAEAEQIILMIEEMEGVR